MFKVIQILAGGKVTVPNRIWKVTVVLPVGTNDAARVTTSTRVIAVDTPNSSAPVGEGTAPL